MHINDLNPERVLFVGDVHSNFNQMSRAIEYAHDNDIKVIVQLGDFGIWGGSSGTRFIDKTSALLSEYEIWLLFVDGNHENFDILYSFPLDKEDGTRPIYPYIAHLPRGLRWEWNGISFVALGGAHSVDRAWRKEGLSWWPEEWVSDSDLEKVIEGGHADVAVMHDSPLGSSNAVTDDPFNPGIQLFPAEDLVVSATHRARLETAIKVVDPYFILHGHYHKFMIFDDKRESSNHICTTVGLDEGGARHTKDFIFDVELKTFSELRDKFDKEDINAISDLI